MKNSISSEKIALGIRRRVFEHCIKNNGAYLNQIKTQNIPIIVVESDEDRKKIAEDNGLEVLCADATLDETLKLAGLDKCNQNWNS